MNFEFAKRTRLVLVGILFSAGVLIAASVVSDRARLQASDSPDCVRVRDGRFEREGRPYYFIGANLWYGAMLGASGASGDRDRLERELDRLQELGVSNLRVSALWEGPDSEPWRVVPSAQAEPGIFREDALEGLDFLLAEAARRNLTVVLILNNFWPWSGGMAQYLAWTGMDGIPYPPPHPGGDWGVFQEFSSRFYSHATAVDLFRSAIRKVVTRVNSVTGTRYVQDPSILAWELANEPRGGTNTAAFNEWIDSTARYIKSLDPNHLVTTGSEGATPWPAASGLDVIANHSSEAIDYVTAHVWAQNWGWYDPAQSQQTIASAIARMRSYVRAHVSMAAELRKPLVLEEFGLSRARGELDPMAPVGDRDRYFSAVFEEVYRAALDGAPVGGANFWAWAGEGLPNAQSGEYWLPGQPLTGDPPHEPQGWYGVYAHDRSTLDVIRAYARKFSELGRSAQ